MTNAIRPGTPDEPALGMAKSSPRATERRVALRGSVRKRRRGAPGVWRRNGQAGCAREAGRPARQGKGRCSCSQEPKSRLSRRQRVHTSDEAPVMGVEQRDPGRWRRDGHTVGSDTCASATGYARRRGPRPLDVDGTDRVDGAHADGARRGGTDFTFEPPPCAA